MEFHAGQFTHLLWAERFQIKTLLLKRTFACKKASLVLLLSERADILSR